MTTAQHAAVAAAIGARFVEAYAQNRHERGRYVNRGGDVVRIDETLTPEQAADRALAEAMAVGEAMAAAWERREATGEAT